MASAYFKRWIAPKTIMLSIATNHTYKKLCILLSLGGYIPSIFVQPMMHGGTWLENAIANALLVLGGYCTLELVRSPAKYWVRIAWGIWLIPYSMVIGISIYFAIHYVPRLFAS